MQLAESHIVRTLDQLATHYGQPQERSVLKQTASLDKHSRAFIATSPFLILATYGPSGVDCSPRGDQPGFVQVVDDVTLLLPDRRGNNRIDSLKNIVQNPAVGLIFLVPGINETFRVNGRAQISTDPALCQRFTISGETPATVIVVTVEEAFVQCARALLRSDLWNPERHARRDDVPTMGTMLAAHTGGKVDAENYDNELGPRLKESLY